jgi:DNA polymerase-2
LFVHLGSEFGEEPAVEKGHGLACKLNAWWKDRIRQEFRLESFLEVEFETHFIRFLMPTIRGAVTGSKKRYAGTVRSGAGEYSLVFKGLETVRSDWTPLARSFQQELYRRIFFNKPYRSYIREITEQLKGGELDNQLVYRKRLRRPLESYQRNIPPHVQAARKSGVKSRWVKYCITLNGPEPLDNITGPLDYRHYMERQLAPAADGILHFLDESFEHITAEQMDLF